MEEDLGAGQFNRWVTHYDYDDAGADPTYAVTRYCTPTSVDSYTPGIDGAAGPSLNLKSGEGLIYTFSYTTDLRLQETRVQKGTGGSEDALVKVTYGESGRPWLPTKFERYRVAGASVANDIETIELLYEFHSTGTTSDIAWVEVTFEAERDPAENGPGGSYYRHEFFNTEGQNYWSRDPTDILTRREFDSFTGALTEIEVNADDGASFPSAPGTSGVSFTGRYADGGSLTTTYTVDDLGRVTSWTNPAGVVTRVVREVRELAGGTGERPGILYFALVTLPHNFTGGFNGPATVTLFNAGGGMIAQSEYSLASDATSVYGDLFSGYDFKLDAELSRNRVTHHVSGLVESVNVWHDVGGDGENGGLYTTSYTYDARGRVEEVTVRLESN